MLQFPMKLLAFASQQMNHAKTVFKSVEEASGGTADGHIKTTQAICRKKKIEEEF